MTYTIRINDTSDIALSIINMLKALKEDYDFIEINNDLNSEVENELDKRYQAFLKNKNGKDWDSLKKDFL